MVTIEVGYKLYNGKIASNLYLIAAYNRLSEEVEQRKLATSAYPKRF